MMEIGKSGGKLSQFDELVCDYGNDMIMLIDA